MYKIRPYWIFKVLCWKHEIRVSLFVCGFKILLERVFKRQKICLTYFKIGQTYFELCALYFFFAPMWV